MARCGPHSGQAVLTPARPELAERVPRSVEKPPLAPRTLPQSARRSVSIVRFKAACASASDTVAAVPATGPRLPKDDPADARITGIQHRQAAYNTRDGRLKGFSVRFRPTGRRTLACNCYTDGEFRRAILGRADAKPVGDARPERLELRLPKATRTPADAADRSPVLSFQDFVRGDRKTACRDRHKPWAKDAIVHMFLSTGCRNRLNRFSTAGQTAASGRNGRAQTNPVARTAAI